MVPKEPVPEHQSMLPRPGLNDTVPLRLGDVPQDAALHAETNHQNDAPPMTSCGAAATRCRPAAAETARCVITRRRCVVVTVKCGR